MSKAFVVTFPKPSETHFQTIGFVVSAIRTEEFGDILIASMLDFPFACKICCGGKV
jgi:hypothetical protein